MEINYVSRLNAVEIACKISETEIQSFNRIIYYRDILVAYL